ncbi:hypothetical protein NQ317_016793 [Molorchus minor]|uniref:Uncharacterized protein n=1 Tax=Molorchus minor TaxID=1323400 RepID=A0ABQ9J5Q6_9CUCU|nr:hypothetical protein NQ317_016793 [Molorchus minor]
METSGSANEISELSCFRGNCLPDKLNRSRYIFILCTLCRPVETCIRWDDEPQQISKFEIEIGGNRNYITAFGFYNQKFTKKDADACLSALKFENLSAEEFDSYWKACTQYRLNDINTMLSSAEVLQKWPFYKKPFGYRLVDMDYDEKCFPHIVAFLQKDGHIKDTAVKALLDNAFKETCDENGKYASILLAIHGYLTTHIKYTIKDSQESFLYCAKTQQAIEEHIMHLKSRKIGNSAFYFMSWR